MFEVNGLDTGQQVAVFDAHQPVHRRHNFNGCRREEGRGSGNRMGIV